MMLPRHHSKIDWHFKFVPSLVTNYIILIIKLIPPLSILDISNGKARLTGKSRLKVKA